MLSDLEARLEDLLNDIAQMPEEYVAKAEKVSKMCYSTSAKFSLDQFVFPSFFV